MHILIHTNNTFLLQLHLITYIEVLSNYVVGVIRGADRDCHLILWYLARRWSHHVTDMHVLSQERWDKKNETLASSC